MVNEFEHQHLYEEDHNDGKLSKHMNMVFQHRKISNLMCKTSQARFKRVFGSHCNVRWMCCFKWRAWYRHGEMWLWRGWHKNCCARVAFPRTWAARLLVRTYDTYVIVILVVFNVLISLQLRSGSLLVWENTFNISALMQFVLRSHPIHRKHCPSSTRSLDVTQHLASLEKVKSQLGKHGNRIQQSPKHSCICEITHFSGWG